MVVFVEVISNSGKNKSTTYKGDDGQTYVLSGDLAVRANNPGNISSDNPKTRAFYEKTFGVIGYAPSSKGEPSVMIFPDVASGQAAQRYLWGTSAYQDLTIEEAAKRWATDAYPDTLAEAAGVPKGTLVKDLTPAQLDAMFAAQAVAEGQSNLRVTDAEGNPLDPAIITGTHPVPPGSIPSVASELDTSAVSSYTVRSGDTLAAIAARNGTSVEALAAINKLADPNKIYAGQELVVSQPSRPMTYAGQEGGRGAPQTPAAAGVTTGAAMAVTPRLPDTLDNLSEADRERLAKGAAALPTMDQPNAEARDVALDTGYGAIGSDTWINPATLNPAAAAPAPARPQSYAGQERSPSGPAAAVQLRPYDPALDTPRPNADGSVSTEVSRTVQMKDGSWANVPSLWWNADSQARDFGSMTDDQLADLATRYEKQTGEAFPRYSDVATAEQAAISRSAAGGGTVGSITATPAIPQSYAGQERALSTPAPTGISGKPSEVVRKGLKAPMTPGIGPAAGRPGGATTVPRSADGKTDNANPAPAQPAPEKRYGTLKTGKQVEIGKTYAVGGKKLAIADYGPDGTAVLRDVTEYVDKYLDDNFGYGAGAGFKLAQENSMAGQAARSFIAGQLKPALATVGQQITDGARAANDAARETVTGAWTGLMGLGQQGLAAIGDALPRPSASSSPTPSVPRPAPVPTSNGGMVERAPAPKPATKGGLGLPTPLSVPSAAPTTKKVTEQVANPAYDAWVQKYGDGSQVQTAATGGYVTKDQLAAIQSGGLPAAAAPPPAPPKMIPVTREVPVAGPSAAPSRVAQPDEAVRSIQTTLNGLGYDSGAADGLLGPRTDAAIRAFQTANGLTVDGIVGPQTRAALASGGSSGGGGSSPAYTVQKGDTLSAIAARNGTTVAALAKANGIADPNKINAGQTLNLGGSSVGVKSEMSTSPAPRKLSPSESYKKDQLGDRDMRQTRKPGPGR